MRIKHLLRAAGVTLLVLLAFNLGVVRFSRSTHRYRFLAMVDAAPPSTSVLFLGNSLVEEGIDTAAFEAAWRGPGETPVALNAALNSTTPVEHALILEHVLGRLPRLRTLVYGYFDDQLSVSDRGAWRDLIHNRTISYDYPDAAAALYAPGSLLYRLQMNAVSRVPMLAERSSLWVKVEQLRRALASPGMPAPDATGGVDVDELRGRCEAIVREDRGLSPAVEELLRVARARGLEVLILEMPLRDRRQGFHLTDAWRAMRAYNRAKLERPGVRYVDASDWIVERSMFHDYTHLSPEGARRFSARLAEVMSGAPPGTTE
jgi:hypothetical protein